MKIGYLGPRGTYSERAAIYYQENYLQTEALLIPCDSIPDAFHKLRRNELDKIIAPVENSIEGTVNVTLDLLYIYPRLYIEREIVISINHYLLSREQSLEQVDTILSHPHALSQCQNFLDRLSNKNIIAVESTAKAAHLAAKTPGSGAIASSYAAQKYGLNILTDIIQDYRVNMTCFWVIGKDISHRTGKDKTSLVFALPENKPGGLYSVLQILADKGIDLSRIQSRPAKKELGEYLFYIDLIGHKEDENIKEALKKLEKKCSVFRILGSYPREGE